MSSVKVGPERPRGYVLARTRPDQSSETLRVFDDPIVAAESAQALSEGDPASVYRVISETRTTLFLAVRGRAHWVRIVR